MATNEVTPSNATNYLVITDSEQNQVIINQSNTNVIQVSVPQNANNITQQPNITVINDPSLKQVNITDQSVKVIQLTALGPQGQVGESQPFFRSGSSNTWLTTASLQISGSVEVSGSTNLSGSVSFFSLVSPYDKTTSLIDVQANPRLKFNVNFWGAPGFSAGGVDANFGNGNTITFSTNNVERMRIQPTPGYVGIGTNNPSASLHIKGTISNPLSASLLVQNTSLSSSLAILENRNVGIGTVSPSASLHIIGATTSSLSSSLLIQNSNTSASFQVWDNGTVTVYNSSGLKAADFLNNVLYLYKSDGTNPVQLYQSPSDVGGYLIIGGQSPGLQSRRIYTGIINYDFSFANRWEFPIVNNMGETWSGNTTPRARFQFEKTAGANVVGAGTSKFIRTTETWAVANAPTNYAHLELAPTINQTGTSTGSVVGIDYNPTFSGITGPNYAALFRTGSVGIGTSIPLSTLDVSGSGRFTNNLVVTGSLLINGSPVGVNTATPRGQMEVNNSLYIGSGAGSYAALFKDANLAGYASGLVFNEIGAPVGIATQGAGKSMIISSADYLRFRSFGGDVAQFNGGNFSIGTISDLSARLGIKGSGTTSATTSLLVQNANASASLVVQDNGFVSIGTGSAAYTLDVSGSGRFTSTLQSNQLNSAIGSVIGGRFFSDTLVGAGTVTYGSYSTNNVANFDIYANNANIGNGALLRLSSRFGGDEGAYLVSARTGSVILAVNGTATFNQGLVLNGSTMNVGIGNLTPSFKLDVSGSGRFVGNLIITGSVTASSALAQGVYFNNILTASANNDTLIGLDITPTFTASSFTGVTNYGLRVKGDDVATSTAYSLYAYGGQAYFKGNFSINTGYNLVVQNKSGLDSLRVRGDGLTVLEKLTVSDGTNKGFVASYSGVGGYQFTLAVTDTGVSFSNSAAASRPVSFSMNTGEILRIHQSYTSIVNNNFLIGTTTNSSFKLDVSGSGRFTSDVTITGSLTATSITSSLLGTASYALTASYAMNGGGGSTFPYTGSAQITGSLAVTGSLITEGQVIDPAFIWFMS